jgi:hypothetical protein
MASSREPRTAPDGSPAAMYPDRLGDGRRRLDKLRAGHLDVYQSMLEVAEGNIYVVDLFVGAVLTRSYSLVDGFITAFDSWNPIVAAPVLRMQIDSLVRIAYVARAPDADEIARAVLDGGEFRRFKDPDGQKLTDRRLIELAKDAHPWVPEVYERTSGWVHLSPAHIHAAWRVEGDSFGHLSGGLPIRPEIVGSEPMDELLRAMTQATEDLITWVQSWEARKGLPPGQSRPPQHRI